MKNFLLRTLVTSSLLILSLHCTKKETKVVREIVNMNGPAQPAVLTEAPQQEGTASGGGSFGDESSEYILKEATDDLVTRLGNLQDPLIKDYPEGWDRKRLIKILKNIRRSKNKSLSRYDRELMFNYGVDEKTGEPYIEALKLFYTSHASIPVNHMHSQDFYSVMSEVRMKLLHELSHHLGIGLTQETDLRARDFAFRLLEAMLGSLLYCQTNDILDPKTKFLKTIPFATWDPDCYEFDLSQLPKDSTFLKESEYFEALEREWVEQKISLLDYEILIDRGTGRAITNANPGSSWSYTVGLNHDQDNHVYGLFSDPDDFMTFHSHRVDITPMYKVRTGRSEKLSNQLNNLLFNDGAPSEMSLRNFFDEVDISDKGEEVYTLNIDDTVVKRTVFVPLEVKRKDGGSFIEAERGYNPTSTFHISELKENIVYNPIKNTAAFKVNQKADLICKKKKVVFDAEIDMPITCRAKEIKAVSVADYSEEIVCGDGPAKHVECFQGGAQ